MGEKLVGQITHYYGRIEVAAVLLSGQLKVGDHIHILGHASDFEQEVTSMELDHQPLVVAEPEQEIGLRVVARPHEGDRVFVVS